eukprot:scaffold12235_cov20-Tisochrysis_lutea.AAC.5
MTASKVPRVVAIADGAGVAAAAAAAAADVVLPQGHEAHSQYLACSAVQPTIVQKTFHRAAQIA